MLSDTTLDGLKSVDPDRYRASLFADKATREKLQLLYAIHWELAKVPELVSEPMIGAIRYQWWRDAVTEIYTGKPVRKHEITTPLTKLFLDHDMPRFWVDQLIDGRERDLDPTPFETMSAAIKYCDRTSGVLLKMAVWLCDATIETIDDYALLGRAWGLTGLARAWGYYHKGILSGLDFKAICQEASKTYDQCQHIRDKPPTTIMPALSYAGLIGGYLERLNQVSFDPEVHRVSYSAWRKQLRFLNCSFSGKV